MIQKRKMPVAFMHIVILIFSLFCCVSGLVHSSIGSLSVSAFLMWTAAMLGAFSKKDWNIIYIFFLFTFFLFLLSRTMVRWISYVSSDKKHLTAMQYKEQKACHFELKR